MLNRYFIRPSTVDRIRACWIGDPIERYVVDECRTWFSVQAILAAAANLSKLFKPPVPFKGLPAERALAQQMADERERFLKSCFDQDLRTSVENRTLRNHFERKRTANPPQPHA